MFRLSNHSMQINFFDHTKIVIYEGGKCLSYIDSNRVMVSKRIKRFVGDADVMKRLGHAREVIKQMLIKKQQRA